MTARIYTAVDWGRARERRAQKGKAPQLAVQRGIYLRQSPQGGWHVTIAERRFGKWGKSEVVCAPTTLERARAAALRAWRQYRLPLRWAYSSDTGCRSFFEGINEPRAVRS